MNPFAQLQLFGWGMGGEAALVAPWPTATPAQAGQFAGLFAQLQSQLPTAEPVANPPLRRDDARQPSGTSQGATLSILAPPSVLPPSDTAPQLPLAASSAAEPAVAPPGEFQRPASAESSGSLVAQPVAEPRITTLSATILPLVEGLPTRAAQAAAELPSAAPLLDGPATPASTEGASVPVESGVTSALPSARPALSSEVPPAANDAAAPASREASPPPSAGAEPAPSSPDASLLRATQASPAAPPMQGAPEATTVLRSVETLLRELRAEAPRAPSAAAASAQPVRELGRRIEILRVLPERVALPPSLAKASEPAASSATPARAAAALAAPLAAAARPELPAEIALDEAPAPSNAPAQAASSPLASTIAQPVARDAQPAAKEPELAPLPAPTASTRPAAIANTLATAQPTVHQQLHERVAEIVVQNARAALLDSVEPERVSLRLDPPELGKLNIEVRLDAEQRVHVLVEAAEEHTRQLLEGELDDLVESLRDRKLEVAHVELRREGADDKPEQRARTRDQELNQWARSFRDQGQRHGARHFRYQALEAELLAAYGG